MTHFSLNYTHFCLHQKFLVSYIYPGKNDDLGQAKEDAVQQNQIPPASTQRTLVGVKYMLEVSLWHLQLLTLRILLHLDASVLKRIIMVFETDKGLLGTIPHHFNRKNSAVIYYRRS